MDNFGSAYEVGGFAQGFGQGMGLINQQQRLEMEKQQAAREQEIFQRGKNKAALLGNLHALNNASMDYENHKPVDAVSILDDNDKVSMQAGAPSIRKMLDPQFGQWHNYAQQVHQNPAIANDPGFIKSANWRFNDELNEPNGEQLDRPLQGTDALTGQPVTVPQGATRVHTEFNAFHPGQNGSFIPELNVHFSYKDKDGQHHAVIQDPMTEGRSILASDNKIKQIDMNDFSNNTIAEAYLHKAISDPSVKARLEGMVLANGGTYDDLYPVRKGQDIKTIFDTSDGSDTYKGIPAGTSTVRSTVIGKDGKEQTVGVIRADEYPQSNIYRGVAAAGINAGARVQSAGIGADARVKAAEIGAAARVASSKGAGAGKGNAANIEALAQSYMQRDGISHEEAYPKAEAVVSSGSFDKYLNQANKSVKDFNSPDYGRNPQEVASEQQKKAIEGRLQLGRPTPAPTKPQGNIAPEGTIITGSNGKLVKRGGKWVPLTGQ